MSSGLVIDARPIPAAATITPAAIFAAFRRQRGAFLLCAVAVPALAFVALSQVTPRFTSTATVVYDPAPYAARELQSILQVDPASDAVMASQVEIARGLGVAERLADRFALFDDPDFNTSLRHPTLVAHAVAAVRDAARAVVAAITGAPPAPPRSVDDVRAATLTAVQDAIVVTPVRGSRAMTIGFVAADRALAADGANEAARLYVEDQLGIKYAAIDRASEWLGGRAAALSAKVADAEAAIVAYRARAGLVQGVQAELATEQASRIATDLQAARGDLAAAEARVRQARGAAQAAISPGAVQARAQAEQVAAQLQGALQKLGPNHPDVRALERQADGLRAAAGAETGRGEAALAADARAAEQKVENLAAALRDAQGAVGRTASAQVPLNAMQRDADAARGLLQAVLERQQQTGQQRAIETPDARVISRALPPLSPSFPRTLPLMAAAIAAGVFLGLCLAYWREIADATFRSGEDVRRVLGLPCLAMLPRLGRRQLGRLPLADYVAARPLSPFAEQTRATRAGLALGTANPRVVAITAARPAEGKTVAAIALGRSAALTGERVVVIDCDMRQPSLGKRLGVDAEAGLVDCLMGHATLEGVIRIDALSGLHVIAAGSTEAARPGLLGSAAMDALMASLRDRYDFVLLDAPPAYAMTDARHVARLADSTLLCVRWHATPRAVVRNAVMLLRDAGATVAGVVLTRVDTRVHTRSGFSDAEIYHPRYGGYFRE